MASAGLLTAGGSGLATPAPKATPGATNLTPTLMNDRFDALVAWLEEKMAEMGIPGAAVGVFQGEDVRTIGLGIADIRSGEPVDTDTAFQIASLTKVFTATGIVAAAANTDLDLAAPVASWFPPFAVSDAVATETATMTHLLSHSSGWADTLYPDSDPATDTLAYYVDQMMSLPQIAQPGKLFNYSNSSFMLAGHILASITGESYASALEGLVLSPIGLTHMGLERQDLSGLRMASGHTPDGDGITTIDPLDFPSAAQPSGGLFGTIDDILRFVRYHSGALVLDFDPLPEAARLLMRVPHGPGGSVGLTTAENIGLGWMLVDIDGRQVAMSQGSDVSQAAAMAFAPDLHFGVAVLVNAESGLFVVNDTIYKALDLFLDARKPGLVPVTLGPDEIAALQGSYAIPNDLSFTVTAGDSGLDIAASAGGEPVLDLSGSLTMTDAATGHLDTGGSPLLFDFIRGDEGPVDFIRFAGRLAPRT